MSTHDKDTNEPIFSLEEAEAKVGVALIDHFSGYTIQAANGGRQQTHNKLKESVGSDYVDLSFNHNHH